MGLSRVILPFQLSSELRGTESEAETDQIPRAAARAGQQEGAGRRKKSPKLLADRKGCGSGQPY